MVCFLSHLPDCTFRLTTCGNHMETTWCLITCLSCVTLIIQTLINNKCYSANMDCTQESDALWQYPLYRTPIWHFSSTFNQTLTSLTLISLQYHSLWLPRQCNCPCNCTQITSSTQHNKQYSTPVQDITTSPARKRGLEEDSNKENQLPGSSSPPRNESTRNSEQLIRNSMKYLK